MRTIFWTPIAALAVCALVVIMFFENLPKIAYNIFHKTKRRISWDVMESVAPHFDDDLDITERYYHD